MRLPRAPQDAGVGDALVASARLGLRVELGAVTFPFPGKPGTWASLPERQGGGHLAGPGRPAGKNPLFESGASREPCPPGREEPCCPHCSTKQPLRDWRECRDLLSTLWMQL